MRRSFLLLPTLCLVAGCAHEGEMDEPRVAAAPAYTSAAASSREVIAVDSMPAEPPPPAPHRRLDHVVTLGETTLEPYAPGQPAPAGNGVVINNNITVNGSDPGNYGNYGGYGGYGGYGSYGGRGSGRGRGTTAQPSNEIGTAAQSPPARQGQTPSVGGNWPTIPSYGPRQMR